MKDCGVGKLKKKKMVREKRCVGEFLVILIICAIMANLVCSAALEEASSLATKTKTTTAAATTTDAYEKIEAYGFPHGILPHTIKSYVLEGDGRFTLYLEDQCKVVIQSKYPLEYDKVITGFLSYGHLRQLQGIRVKAFYVWWGITAISRTSSGDEEQGQQLLFAFGVLSAKFPLANFDDPPVCEERNTLSSASL